jgi:hypothetical protein
MSISYGTSTQILLPNSANNTITYIRERLGEPLSQVNVSDNQILSRIGDALQFCRDYMDDFTEHTYIPHELTQEDIDNNYITVPDNVFEVVKVISPSAYNTSSMFTSIDYNLAQDLNYHMLSNMSASGVITHYTLAKMKLEEYEQFFAGQKSIDFNVYNKKLYWRVDFDARSNAGDFICYECFTVSDPQTMSSIFSDRRFLDLATAMVKKQWGEILSKFPNTPMFGGIVFNGDKIYTEGVREIKEAKDHIIDTGNPPHLFIG